MKGYDNSAASPDFDGSAGVLTSVEVARLFRVDLNTVQAWARAGRMPWCRTPGGDWRFSKRWVYERLGLDL